jgi:uncharacterized protein DUF3168
MIFSIGKGVGDKLAGTAGITAVVSTRIYFGEAPLEAAFPHIVFSLNAGGSTNRSPRDEFDVTLTVKCVAAKASTAAQVADLIRGALHNADLTLESPWNAYRCQHDAVFQYIENKERVQYHHAGGTYRVRAVQ